MCARMVPTFILHEVLDILPYESLPFDGMVRLSSHGTAVKVDQYAQLCILAVFDGVHTGPRTVREPLPISPAKHCHYSN